MQIKMMRAEAVKEELVKFMLLGKILYALSQSLLTRCESEEVYKFNEQCRDFIVPQANHAFNSYFHIILVLGFMLCRFHPFTDKIGVLVHKGDDALVVFGVGVAYSTTLHHFKGFQANFNRFYALAFYGR